MRSTMVVAALALAPVAAAQAWFELPQRIDEVGFGVVEDVGDVDADGDVDLLVKGAGFSILLGDGAGGFAPGASAALPGSTWGVVRFRLADLTGDGLPDVVVTKTDNPDSRLRLYPNQGAGAFGPFVEVALVGNPIDLAIGDQTGDGVPDLAMLQTPQPWASWFTWDGATLVESVRLAVGVPSIDVDVFDWDGDGVLDMLVGEWFDTHLRVLPTVDGAPTPGRVVDLPGPVGSGRRLLVGDLEGDADDDVLVSSCDFLTDTFVWVVENEGPGANVLQPTQTLDDDGIFSVFGPYLGDWDGDGDLDLLNGHSLLNLIENDGDNGFIPAANVTMGFDDVGGGAADLDGDGDLDFAGARAVAWGNGTFESTFDEHLGFGITGLVARDWEGDGDLDVLDRVGRMAVNDGAGTFTPLGEVWPQPPEDFLYDDAAALADLDGDGFLDYLVGYFELVPQFPFQIAEFRVMRRLSDDGTGTFVDAGDAAPNLEQIPEDQNLRRPVVDLEGDGDLDLTVSGGAWINDGSGVFAQMAGLFASGNPVASGDVDGDGDADLLATSGAQTAGSILLHRQTAPLAFASETILFQDPQGFSGESGVLLDLDEDGDLDVAAGGGCQCTGGDLIYVLENDGIGGFTEVDPLVSGFYNGAIIAQQDVDGDGLLDVVSGPFTSDPNGHEIVALRRTGGLDFEAPRSYVIGETITRWADLDEDGDLEAVGLSTLSDSWAFDGPADGVVQQYGAGTAGSGGLEPVLGASGPLRPDSTTAVLNLARALGGTTALLMAGTDVGTAPFAGGTLLVTPLLVIIPLPLPPGGAGEGALALDLTAVTPVTAGLTFTHQVLVADPAAVGNKALSNGLRLTYGL